MKNSNEIQPSLFCPRIVEDRMMAAFRASANNAKQTKRERKERRAILVARRRAADREAACLSTTRKIAPQRPAQAPLPFPTYRHVSARERHAQKTSEDISFFQKMREELKAEIQYRREFGFVQKGIIELSGQSVSGVVEKGLRSNRYKGRRWNSLERFPALVHRNALLRVSDGNTFLDKSQAKILSLDRPYVEGNKIMLGFLRIDTDRVWPSVEAAVEAFMQVAREGRVACPPTMLVGLVDKHGRFWRPHAIWYLPFVGKNSPNKVGPVLNDRTAKGYRQEPVDLFHAVYRGLVNAHLHLGADANAPAATQQTKNPLCPLWNVEILNDDICLELGVHAQFLDMTKTKDRLAREQAQIQTGVPLKVSNGLYNTLSKLAYSFLADWHFAGDPEYHATVKAGKVGRLAERIHMAFEKMDLADLAGNMKRAELVNVMANVAERAADNWDAKKLDKGVQRGMCLHEVQGKPKKAAQAIGVAHSRSIRAEKIDERIQDAVSDMMTDGIEVTKKGLAKATGCSINTVRSRWSMVEAIVMGGSDKCIVKKRRSLLRPSVSTLPTSSRSDRHVPESLPQWLLDAEQTATQVSDYIDLYAPRDASG